MLRGDGVVGYFRVAWFTPAALPTWGDTHLTVIGTDGYIEVRENVELAGRDGDNHLFIANKEGVRYENCSNSSRMAVRLSTMSSIGQRLRCRKRIASWRRSLRWRRGWWRTTPLWSERVRV
jgi:diaminopimelate epimerase